MGNVNFPNIDQGSLGAMGSDSTAFVWYIQEGFLAQPADILTINGPVLDLLLWNELG